MKQTNIKSLLLSEYLNLPVFAVSFLCLGIILAFNGLQIDINLLLLILLVTLTLCLILKLSKIKPILWCLLWFICGIYVSNYHIQNQNTTLLKEPLYQAVLTGVIDDISYLPDKQQITLSSVQILNYSSVQHPTKIQLIYNKETPSFSIGSKIKTEAFIRPLRSPEFFYGYNEKRILSSKGIGGIGYIKNIIDTETPLKQNKNFIHTIKTFIQFRLQELLSNQTAQIAIPLTIGEQGVVSQHLYDIFRSSGIIHILSVSGYHLTLLACFIFFFVRGLLSLIPKINQYQYSKQIAAVLALICSGFYILISGMQAPALRSFIMLAIVLIGILFSRNTLSLRTWTISAILLLLYQPELLFNIGFQLSFMAVLAIITLYEKFRLTDKIKSFSFPVKIFLNFFCFNFFIAFVTAPFVIFYFNQYPLYGFLGNLLTSLIISFWIMPCLFIGLILMPLSMDTFFIKIAGISIDYIILICEKIHHLPHATLLVPALSLSSLFIIVSGIFLFCLMKTKLKYIGLILFLTGVGLNFLSKKPDLMIGDNGLTIASRTPEGNLNFIAQGPNDYLSKIWLRKNGEDKEPPPFTKREKTLISIKNKSISFDKESCLNADICFLYEPSIGNKTYLLEKNKNYYIYFNKEDISIKTP